MKKTIKRSRVDGFAHPLQLKTPTLASEQRNAHLNHLNRQESAAPKQTNKPGQTGGHYSPLWSQKKKVTTIADRRTSRNGRSEKNKPQTPGGVPLEESIGSNLKLPSGL